MDSWSFERRKIVLSRPGEFGNVSVGRGAPKEQVNANMARHQEFVRGLEEEKLAGFRFLKPPGATKTLKNIHEENLYEEVSSTVQTAESPIESPLSAHSPPHSVEAISNEASRDENMEDEDLAFTPNLSFPTMDASLPSLYYRE